MKKKAVIFDFNGTLFFDSDKHIEAWNICSERLIGRKMTDEEVTKMLGRTNKLILELILKKEPADDLVEEIGSEKERIYRELCLRDRGECKLAPGAVELLDKLTERNIKVAIATSSDIDNVKFYFDYFGISKWFNMDNVIYNDGTVAGKPKPDIYLKAIERLGVSADEAVVFEDAVSGIKSARAAKAGKTVGVLSIDNRKELEEAGADEIINDFYDISSIDELLS